MRIHAVILPLVLTSAAAVAHAGDPPLALQPPAEPPHRPVGISALTPHEGGVIDEKQVRDYVAKSNLPRNQGAASEVQVLSVEMVTVDDAREKVGIDTTGFKGSEPVALARLGGKLVFTGPPPGEPMTFTQGYVVFDGETGNLLALGALPEK